VGNQKRQLPIIQIIAFCFCDLDGKEFKLFGGFESVGITALNLLENTFHY